MSRIGVRVALAALVAIAATTATVVWPSAASATASCSPFGTATFAVGDGSAGSPWEIATAADVNALRADSYCWSSGMHFVQTADIDMGGATWTTNGIGDGNSAFWADYDGTHHRISGLTISDSNVDYLGLFGRVRGTVRNLGFTGAVTGMNYVGGLVGSLTLSGTVTGSYATGAVAGNEWVGGLVGNSDGVITSSYASGAVHAGNYVGGLVGQSYGTVSGSYATGTVFGDIAIAAGDIVGGLVGRSTSGASVSSSYATGAVTGHEDVGGLVGYNRGAAVSDSYSIGSTTGVSNVGGFIGRSTGSVSNSFWDTQASGTSTAVGDPDITTPDVTGETTVAMQTLATFTSASTPWSITDGWSSSSTWGMCTAVNSGYPYLTSFHVSDPCSGGSSPSPTASPSGSSSPSPTASPSGSSSPSGTSSTQTSTAAEHSSQPAATSTPTQGYASGPTIRPAVNGLAATSLAVSVTLVDAATADGTRHRYMRKSPSLAIGKAPKVKAKIGGPVSLVARGVSAATTYTLKVKISGVYATVGPVTSTPTGQIYLPVLQFDAAGQYPLALVSPSGAVRYLKVIV